MGDTDQPKHDERDAREETPSRASDEGARPIVLDEPGPGTTTPLIARVEQAKQRPISGPGEPVDHERQPGVPPPATTDYEDIVDIEGAESFPASDPPSGW